MRSKLSLAFSESGFCCSHTDAADSLMARIQISVSRIIGMPLRTVRLMGHVMSALRSHILHVAGVVAQEEMFGPNTRRVITAMENLCLIRDWAIGQNPRETMGQHQVLIPITENPIARAVSPTPSPTSIGLGDVLPEGCNSLFRGILSRHRCSFTGVMVPDVSASRHSSILQVAS